MPMKSHKKAGKGRPVNPERQNLQNEKILIAAANVFADKGYFGTEMQAIADTAGVAKGTLYLYCKGKEDLFFRALERVMLLLRERIRKEVTETEDPLIHFRQNTICVLNFFDEYPEYTELLVQERAVFKNWENSVFMKHGREEMKNQCKDHEQCIRDGKIRNIPEEYIFMVFSDLIYGAILNKSSAHGNDFKLSRKADAIIDICMHGILSDRERKKWS